MRVKDKKLMKRTTAVILAAVLLFAVMPAAAWAENGPMGVFEAPWGESLYLAYIQFLETDENGDFVMETDGMSIRSHVVFADDTAWNEPTGEKLESGGWQGMNGAVYDRASNTLTITNLSADNMVLSTNVMGDDFTLRVEGDCTIGEICVWGDGYGGSLHIEGDGSLTVNPNKVFENAIILQAEFTASVLSFGSQVTVNLFAGENAAVTRMNRFAAAGSAFSFANGAAPEIVKEQFQSQRERRIYGFEIVDPEDEQNAYRLYSAMEAVNAEDPEGLYAVNLSHRIYPDGSEDDFYEVLKLIYSEKYGAYFKDFAFSYEYGDEWGNYELSPEEFAQSPYQIVCDEYGEEQWVENIYEYQDMANVYQDSSGNEYGVIHTYQDGGEIVYAVRFEAIDGMNDVYAFIAEPSVDVDALEPIFDVEIYDDLYNYTLTGTQFLYVPAQPDKEQYVSLGDINGDSKINSSDARVVLRVAAKLENLDEVHQKIADVNKDGKVNSSDARMILRAAAKLEPLSAEQIAIPA